MPLFSTARAQWIRWILRGICTVVLLASHVTQAQENPPAPAVPATADTTAAPKIPPEQLESLVAPIALYPDPLLAQTLVASTYPLEIIQLQQWLLKHKDLKDQALTDSLAKEPWDPSIQSMAAVPEVVERLANDIQWTTDLGNAFLAQQGDVMDAVQRMRKKAQDTGALKSNEQQKVETKVVEEKTVIVVESSDPEVIYVPAYSPTVVYGPPVYPYPPIYYPPYPPGAAFMTFSIGVMWGAAWGGSCCGCGWGGNNVNINVDNNFNRIERGDVNVGDGNRGDRGQGNRGDGDRGQGNRGQGNRGQTKPSQGNTWQHNPQHRGAAPYGDKATANKFGGATRGESPGNRAASARQQGGWPSSSAGSRPGGAGGAGVSDRSRTGAQGGAGVSDRSRSGGQGGAGGQSATNRAGAGGTGSRAGGDQIGNRSIPKGGESKSGGGFSGGSRGYSGSSARASSSRGASSMGSRGGGGRGGRR